MINKQALSELGKYGVNGEWYDYANCMSQKEKKLEIRMQYKEENKIFEGCFLIGISKEVMFERIDVVIWRDNPLKEYAQLELPLTERMSQEGYFVKLIKNLEGKTIYQTGYV